MRWAPFRCAAADWAWSTFWDGQNLQRIHRNKKTHITGFLEDYAYFCEALIALYRISRNREYLTKTEILLNRAIELFYDKDTEQLAFTPNIGEQLFYRKSDLNDDVTPSPNASLATALFQMSQYTNNPVFSALSYTLIAQVSKTMSNSPGWYFHWCKLAQAQTLGGCHVTFYGETTASWDNEDVLTLMKQLPSWALVEYAETTSAKHIVICSGQHCMPPVNSIDQALEVALDCCRLVD